jgi:hypothetical protein
MLGNTTDRSNLMYTHVGAITEINKIAEGVAPTNKKILSISPE